MNASDVVLPSLRRKRSQSTLSASRNYVHLVLNIVGSVVFPTGWQLGIHRKALSRDGVIDVCA